MSLLLFLVSLHFALSWLSVVVYWGSADWWASFVTQFTLLFLPFTVFVAAFIVLRVQEFLKVY